MNRMFQLFIEDVGFVIDNDLHESELLNTKVFDDLMPLVHNGKYRSYRTRNPHQIYGSPFYIRFYFMESKITSLHLHCAIDYGISSSIMDVAQLENAKKFNDQWLMNQLGVNQKGVEPWGSVESVIDKKGWSASIIFRFSDGRCYHLN